MSKQVRLTKKESIEFTKLVVKKYSLDETICLLNRQLKEANVEIGVLKSELSELKDTNSQITASKFKERIRKLEHDNRQLKHTIIANRIPLPSSLIDKL